MKKSDLIKMLERVPDDAEVRIEQATHDHRRSHLAQEVGDVEETGVAWTGYHESDEVLGDDEAEKFDQEVWLITTRDAPRREVT